MVDASPDEGEEEEGAEGAEAVWSWFMAKGGMSCLMRPLADACSIKRIQLVPLLFLSPLLPPLFISSSIYLQS